MRKAASHTFPLLPSSLVLLPPLPHPQGTRSTVPILPPTHYTPPSKEGQPEGCGSDSAHSSVPSKLSSTPFSSLALPSPLRGPHNEEGRPM